MSDAQKCRDNGWTVGTRLVGDEGYGPTVIEITAIGRWNILAVRVSQNGVPPDLIPKIESMWTLDMRDWRIA